MIMNKEQLFQLLGINDLIDLHSAINRILFGEKQQRDKFYQELLELNGYDLSFDWFQTLYENELSERKQKKQDFTPKELGLICSSLTGLRGTLHEPTAGNGSMIISDWYMRIRRHLPWEYYPSQNMVTCWELSDRSIPILLLNLSIRGIMGYVYHGDVLERTIKQKYILLNRTDDALSFSDIIKTDINSKIVQE